MSSYICLLLEDNSITVNTLECTYTLYGILIGANCNAPIIVRCSIQLHAPNQQQNRNYRGLAGQRYGTPLRTTRADCNA